jgi:hypothetical protein
MKTLWVVALLLLASVCYGQITEQYTRSSVDSGYVGTSWTKVKFPSNTYYKIIRCDIDYDTLAYARKPFLKYAFNNDTLETQTMSLRPGYSIRHDGIGINWMWIKASQDSVPYNIALYR